MHVFSKSHYERGMSTGFIIGAIVLLAIVIVALYVLPSRSGEKNTDTMVQEPGDMQQARDEVVVTPISHASFVLTWGDAVVYNDPVGGAAAFSGQSPADLVLVSDIHGDHLDEDTLLSVVTPQAIFIAPEAVVDTLESDLANRALVLANGQNTTQAGIRIEAMPMYNLPESEDSRHTKGRGNGYLLEKDGTRVYIAGDTADIPEMRTLQNIDIAFIPMNEPFTMNVETAADAVLSFAPKRVYPYHYRGQNGLGDIERFEALVQAGNPNIEVVSLNWYPEGE